MSITVTNPKGREIEFKSQRGPTCGLYALSFVLDYLYGLSWPATKDHKESDSLREVFKCKKRSAIGELFDSSAEMAKFINDTLIEAEKCRAEVCSVEAIQKALASGGLCMVPFCVEIDWKLPEYGYPCNSGIHAHWCVLRAIPDKAKSDEVQVLHWGDEIRIFSLNALVQSNHSIKNVNYGQWAKEVGKTMEYYFQCSSSDPSKSVPDEMEPHTVHELNASKAKPVDGSRLEENLKGRMLVFDV